MKIISYILALTVLGLSVGAWYYADQQQKVMEAVVKVSGGKSEADGLSSAVKTAKKDKNEANDAMESAKKVTSKACDSLNAPGAAIEKRNIAQANHKKQIEYHKSMKDELASTEKNYADAEKRAEALLETMKQLDGLSEVADLTEVVDTFTAIVEEAKEENGKLKNQRDEKVELRTAKTTKVANETETLATLDKQNSDFAANYRKNVVEYPVLTIVAERKLVLFTVPAESGIVSGAALLVKRGDNTIAVLRVENVSDNQVTAKYTLAPGQELQLGDRVIHVKPHGS